MIDMAMPGGTVPAASVSGALLPSTSLSAGSERSCSRAAAAPHCRYEAGKRTGAWIKLKLHLEQEFVIGGYTDPEGGRKYFGSLLVGFYEGKNLKFAGRVGTGFSDQLLRSLYSDLEKIRIEQCPFFNVPAVGRSRWDQGLTAAEMRRCHWVKPVMVCQVKFTEWTRDDRLRQPVFLGLREDKKASEVMREKAT